MSKIQLYLALGLFLLLNLPACAPLNQEEEILADCFITFHLFAYEDFDGDGVRDAEDDDLPGIEFVVNGFYAHSVAGGRAVTDEAGQATIDTWSPGECLESSTQFSIDAIASAEYIPSTDLPFEAHSDRAVQEYAFGFQPGFAECGLLVDTLAWIDQDQDGLYDEDELPLQDVFFVLRQVDAPASTMRGEAFSDPEGFAYLDVFDVGCSAELSRWEVVVEVPENYRLTTDAVVNLSAIDFDQPVPFGFYPAGVQD